ncbi:phage portal protein [Actinomadura violacea]|uniref:Phage portal protein n=1 Tax=Actinomadura violacea TaxID=2819934 RepID=A0ABS3RWP1_9ACTN|nr:phage portal protein [Actinomadura violacea]MBO2461173.1 phage portal protein [Actinomadura violacea]
MANDVWPPPELAPIHDRMAVWSAWWTGEPDELEYVYGGDGVAAVRPPNWPRRRPLNRPSQYRGGIVGALARMFWGRPTPEGELRSKIHMPIASDISVVSANLLFADPLTFKTPHKATTDRLQELQDDGMQATLREAAETASALGGVYLRTSWDKDIADRPWLSVVQPDCAIPTFRYGRLREVMFWTVIEDDGQQTVVRHLETHKPGVIRHQVFVGTPTSLGQLAPLGDFEDTEPFARIVENGDEIPTGIDLLTAGYIPNIRPNRIWRNLPEGVNLGRSDYQGVEAFMDSLDETWTSWMRDIRLGKARILADRAMLESEGRGQGAYLDLDREVFTPVEINPMSGQSLINEIQFSIRVQEHQDTTQALLETIVRSSGYSAQSFGLVADTALTATEVQARKEQSFQTKAHKINYVRPVLAHMNHALLAIEEAAFERRGLRPQPPDIEWAPGITPDPADTAQTVSLLVSARAVSLQTRVEMVHPDWDEPRVLQEVERIKAEEPSPLDQIPAAGAGRPGFSPLGEARPINRDSERAAEPAGSPRT